MRFYYFGQFMPVSRLENRTDQRNISSFYFCHVSLYFLDRLPKASVNQISRNFAHLPIPVYCSNTGKPNFQNWLNSTIELHKSGQPLRIVVKILYYDISNYSKYCIQFHVLIRSKPSLSLPPPRRLCFHRR